MKNITWKEFESVQICVGTITDAKDFPEARNAAYIITADFGNTIGTKKSSAQITDLYTKEELLGKQIIGVLNFAPKKLVLLFQNFWLRDFTEMMALSCWQCPTKKSQMAKC